MADGAISKATTNYRGKNTVTLNQVTLSNIVISVIPNKPRQRTIICGLSSESGIAILTFFRKPYQSQKIYFRTYFFFVQIDSLWLEQGS